MLIRKTTDTVSISFCSNSLLSYLKQKQLKILSILQIRTIYSLFPSSSLCLTTSIADHGKVLTHYPLASVVLPLQTLSVASLKLTASSRPTSPPSGSTKCLRFGHWLTLCTLIMHLLTYLLTYLLKVR